MRQSIRSDNATRLTTSQSRYNTVFYLKTRKHKNKLFVSLDIRNTRFSIKLVKNNAALLVMHFRNHILVNDGRPYVSKSHGSHWSVTSCHDTCRSLPLVLSIPPCYISKYPIGPFHPAMLPVEVFHWSVPPATLHIEVPHWAVPSRHATCRSTPLVRSIPPCYLSMSPIGPFHSPCFLSESPIGPFHPPHYLSKYSIGRFSSGSVTTAMLRIEVLSSHDIT